MTCSPACVQPSPSQAHCSVCHITWSGITGFDLHQRQGQCRTPAELGYTADARGVYRAPITDAKRAQLAALRRRDADAGSARLSEPSAAQPPPAGGIGYAGPSESESGGSR